MKFTINHDKTKQINMLRILYSNCMDAYFLYGIRGKDYDELIKKECKKYVEEMTKNV